MGSADAIAFNLPKMPVTLLERAEKKGEVEMKALAIAAVALTLTVPAHAFTISGSFVADAPTYRSNASNDGGLVGVAVSDGKPLVAGLTAWTKLNPACQAIIVIGDRTADMALAVLDAGHSANGEDASTITSVTVPAGDIVEAFANTADCTKGTIAFSAQSQ
jgi:hypothetical protein